MALLATRSRWGSGLSNVAAGVVDARPHGRSPFVFDLRAVGLFRILLALTILADQCIRLGDWHAFHSAAGVISAADSRAWESPWVWSVYWLSDGALLPYVLEVLRFLVSLTLLLGIRSRLSAFVLFVLLASLTARNPLLLQGGDKTLVVMAFFAAFLPLGQRYSLTAQWFGPRPQTAYRSMATAAYAIQVLLVWFMAGILKTGEQWWSDGTAVSMALHLEAFTTEFARHWRHWDWLVGPLTLVVFWMECLGPLLMLVPALWCRVIGLVALVGLEIGIWLSLEVGLFPFISLVSIVPLVPTRVVDALARWHAAKADPKGSDLVLFFDRECRFCAFACRFLLACCGIRGAALREAQSDPVAARILEDSFAWSVAEPADGSPGSAPRYRRGWDAVLVVVQRSARPWLRKVLPGPAAGERVYAWIGNHRGAIGATGGMLFGRGDARGVHGTLGRLFVASALVLVLAWNAATYPPLREWRDFRPWLAPLVYSLNLAQYWSMFAPYPYLNDYWHILPALSREGVRVHLLSGRPVSFEVPPDGPDHYGGYRWRKTVFRSLERDEIDRVFRYFCRTGEWTAFDLWELSRPNLGTAATADVPYEAFRQGRWQCDDVDEDVVEAFRSEVDAMMEPYLPDA